jgi:hypothetical protein
MDSSASTQIGALPGDAWRTFDRWSSALFLALAVLGLLAAIAVVGMANGTIPAIATGATIVIAALGSVVLYAVAAGLDRGRSWARPAAWAALVILVGAGLVGAAVDLAHGRITVPLGAVVAAVVLAKRPGPLPAAGWRDRRIAVGLSGLLVASFLGAGMPSWLTTSADSPLTAGPEALDLRLEVGCQVAGSQRIPVTASWSWRRRDAVPFGTDGLGVAWDWDGEGGDQLPFDAQSIVASEWLWSGGGSPSAGVIDQAMAGAGVLQSLGWGIDVDRGGLADAGVRFELIPPDARPGATFGHGSLTVRAVYAHLDRWTVRSATTCAW